MGKALRTTTIQSQSYNSVAKEEHDALVLDEDCEDAKV
jgi:hypothetical protein